MVWLRRRESDSSEESLKQLGRTARCIWGGMWQIPSACTFGRGDSRFCVPRVAVKKVHLRVARVSIRLTH